MSIVATQRASSTRLFMSFVLAGTETILSLCAGQTNKTGSIVDLNQTLADRDCDGLIPRFGA